MDASTAQATRTHDPVVTTIVHPDDLDLCEALYWLRRARRREDPVMVDIWTERMNELLDRRLPV